MGGHLFCRKMKYDTILWDVDDTLLDFPYSEKYAVRHCFEEIGLTISDAWLARYSCINQSYWKKLEKGEVTKKELLRRRFADLFEEMGIQGVAMDTFQVQYQKALGDVYCYLDDSYEVCKKLKGSCRQYLITNGVESTQRNKLKLSGLDVLMEDIFISEVLGSVKPKKEFFDLCFAQIPDFKKDRVLVIGDSLSSDIQGAKNAGVASCWYNPKGKALTGDVIPDYEIQHLSQVEEILFG